MRFARWLFAIAAVWGFIVVAPMYFLETQLGIDYPPPVSRPEIYYGFVGVVLSSQLLYVLIAIDPLRFRPIMLVGAIGKLSFFGACLVLHLQGRVVGDVVAMTAPDLVLAILFCVAWYRTGKLAA